MKKYPSYKESGIAWIGQVPEHWETKALRAYLTIVSEKGHGDKPLLSVTREQGVIVRDVENQDGNHNYIPDDLNGYKLVKVGQFAINKMKSWQGSYGVSDYEGIVSPAYYVCDLVFPFKPYFSMAIRSRAYIPFFNQYSKGIRIDQWDLSTNALKTIPFIEPPIDEQEAIVRFIEDKVEKIDRYVSEKQRQVAALDELRQAEIARAVTRGLNPDVPLRDSGIDWIGQIPEHWDVCINLNLFREDVRLADENETPLSLSQKDGLISTDNLEIKTLKTASYKGWKHVSKNDLVLNRFKAHLGVLLHSRYEGMVSFHYGVYKPLRSLVTEYYDLLFHHPAYKYIFSYKSKGMTVGLQNLSNTDFYSVPAIYPPYDEQMQIVEYVKQRTLAIDRMKTQILKEIELLKEYKQRLISDAVTGQIDVRDYNPATCED